MMSVIKRRLHVRILPLWEYSTVFTFKFFLSCWEHRPGWELFLAEMSSGEDCKQLVADLAIQFYNLGWFPGSGGSLTIRKGSGIFSLDITLKLFTHVVIN
jgi:hypothetical protein